MRGVEFVQVPTTVLAQVDASIGGKTAVNLTAGKNLLGTFHQPRVVLIDPMVLKTFPDREFRSGLYEALKCGIIGNVELFLRFEQNYARILKRDPTQLEWLVTQSVRLKAEVVSADEREGGLRRVLNLGHTIGHALEAETGYRKLLHGEAVAWGMVAAAHIACAVGRTDRITAGRIVDAVFSLGPLPQLQVNPRRILARLQSDKKTQDGVVHFILPREIGKVEITNDVPETAIIARRALARFTVATRKDNGKHKKETAVTTLNPVTEIDKPTVIGTAPEGTSRSGFGCARRARDVYLHCASLRPARTTCCHSTWIACGGGARPARSRTSSLDGDARVLDLCCGTGDMAFALRHKAGKSPARIFGADFSHAMLQRASAKSRSMPTPPAWIEADALSLPFPAAHFDLVTSAFGFRNLADYDAGLREILRVLRPGGEVGILDFGEPSGLMGAIYRIYFKQVLPRIGTLISGVRGPYAYLPASVLRFPAPAEMITRMKKAGFAEASWTSYTFGIAGLYRGKKKSV